MKVMSFCKPAAKMTGVPRRKEKRVAATGFSLLSRPAAIVIPDRDVPGNNAIACAHPIRNILSGGSSCKFDWVLL